jgi:hypothetical protein
MGISINTPGQKPDLRTLLILAACAAIATLLSSCNPRQTASVITSGPSSPYAGAASVQSGWHHQKSGYAFPQGRTESDVKGKNLRKH